MFLGHYAVALGSKRLAPAVSLGTLIAAATLLDLIWPVLVIAGVERVAVVPGATAFTPLDFRHYPLSHSLLMSIVWGSAFGGAYYFIRRRPLAAIVLGLLVVSHWFLDALVHRPDLPLTLSGPQRIGLGLWNSVPGTLIVELVMFAAGVALYVRATGQAARRDFGLRIFVLALLALYAGAAFGPPPPSAGAVAWSDMGQWLVIAWAAWVDRRRSALRSAAAAA